MTTTETFVAYTDVTRLLWETDRDVVRAALTSIGERQIRAQLGENRIVSIRRRTMRDVTDMVPRKEPYSSGSTFLIGMWFTVEMDTPFVFPVDEESDVDAASRTTSDP